MKTDTTLSGQTFRFSRFAVCFRRYLGFNCRRLLLLAGGILASFLIISIFQLLMLYEEIQEYGPDQLSPLFFWGSNADILSFVVPFIATVGGSLMYSSMNTRQNRLTELSLPASQFEKFLTYFIIYLPLLLCVTFLLFWISDALKVLAVRIFTTTASGLHTMSLWRMIRFYGGENWTDYQTTTTLTIYTVILSGNALFALGSIVFQKYSYLKSYCFIFILQSAMMILAISSYILLFPYGNTTFRYANLSYPAICWIITITGLVATVGLQLLAYLRFKESEYISRW